MVVGTVFGPSVGEFLALVETTKRLVRWAERQVRLAEGVRYDRVAAGTILGQDLEALADTCATNFISTRLLRKLGRTFDETSTKKITLADGSIFSTLGSITLPWRFTGESEPYLVDFNVIRSRFCQYPVILGGEFLQESQSLAKHAARLFRLPRKRNSSHVRFQGGGQLRIPCQFGDLPVNAFPDSASDVPLMSPDFAKRLSRTLDSARDHRIELRLPGNRFVKAQGIVRDVKFALRDEIHSLDFYVLDGLPGDVLLDEGFLTRIDAFPHAGLLGGEGQQASFPETDIYLAITKISHQAVSELEKALQAVDLQIAGLVEDFLTVQRSHASPAEKQQRENELNISLSEVRLMRQQTVQAAADILSAPGIGNGQSSHVAPPESTAVGGGTFPGDQTAVTNGVELPKCRRWRGIFGRKRQDSRPN